MRRSRRRRGRYSAITRRSNGNGDDEGDGEAQDEVGGGSECNNEAEDHDEGGREDEGEDECLDEGQRLRHRHVSLQVWHVLSGCDEVNERTALDAVVCLLPTN